MTVVLGGDSPPVLEPTEQPLDDGPAAADVLVEWVRGTTHGSRWDYGLDASVSKPAAQRVSVIGFVGNETADRRGDAQQWNGHADISEVAGCQDEGDQPAAIMGQAVDLAGRAPTRAADRFLPLPLF